MEFNIQLSDLFDISIALANKNKEDKNGKVNMTIYSNVDFFPFRSMNMNKPTKKAKFAAFEKQNKPQINDKNGIYLNILFLNFLFIYRDIKKLQ